MKKKNGPWLQCLPVREGTFFPRLSTHVLPARANPAPLIRRLFMVSDDCMQMRFVPWWIQSDHWAAVCCWPQRSDIHFAASHFFFPRELPYRWANSRVIRSALLVAVGPLDKATQPILMSFTQACATQKRSECLHLSRIGKIYSSKKRKIELKNKINKIFLEKEKTTLTYIWTLGLIKKNNLHNSRVLKKHFIAPVRNVVYKLVYSLMAASSTYVFILFFILFSLVYFFFLCKILFIYFLLSKSIISYSLYWCDFASGKM